MNATQSTGPGVNVIELNRYAPRPFVFTDLALCLRDSIRAAGFASNILVNDADQRVASIVLGATPALEAFVERLDPAKTAVLNLEQLGSNSPLVGPSYLGWLRNQIVVDYHSCNIERLKAENGNAQRVFELPIVPSPSVAHVSDRKIEKSVDVLFFGTRNKRRLEILRRLEAAGISVETVVGAYGKELTPAIMRARIVLHVHFYETALFPIARILQPVVNAVPIVCENSSFSKLSDWSQSGILFAPYGAIVDACQALLRSTEEQGERGRRAKSIAEQIDFALPFKRVYQALNAQSGSGGP